MAWQALSPLINQLQAFLRSGMQMCVRAESHISQGFSFRNSSFGIHPYSRHPSISIYEMLNILRNDVSTTLNV